MALVITRNIGTRFTIQWPSGDYMLLQFLGPKFLLIVESTKCGKGGYLELSQKLNFPGNPEQVHIAIGVQKFKGSAQWPIIIDAPRSVRIHRDNMKKGYDHD